MPATVIKPYTNDAKWVVEEQDWTNPPTILKRKEFLHPVRLIGKSPDAFSITTAGPTIPHLMRLIKAYVGVAPSMRDGIAATHLWIHSLEIPGLTPICLALMLICAMQVGKFAIPASLHS